MASEAELDPEICEELEHRIDRLLRTGLLSATEIVEDAVMHVAPFKAPAGLAEHANAYFEGAWGSLREEQKGWPEVTDCDRLDRAFADLESRGIIVREDFSCCTNCGHRDIIDELEEAAGARGYAFYQEQDTESAVEGGVLWLAHGAVDEGADAYLAVAAEIVGALRAQGLDVQDDGSGENRITVSLTWQRRLPQVGAS